MKSYDSIHLFKKNREAENTTQKPLTKENLPVAEQQLPELSISPLKNKKISQPKNYGESPLPPGIAKLIKKALGFFGIDRNK